MGKIEGFQHTTFYKKSRLWSGTKQSQNLVWVPKIPTWEKEFCYKIGLFTWENFLEAKKMTRFSYKVLEWNDSAAEEAFNRSKMRFFATINGVSNPYEFDDYLSPDLYIDEIDWDEEDDGSIESANSDGEEDEEERVDGINGEEVIINPTGWDCKDEEFSAGKVLMGLIVGY